MIKPEDQSSDGGVPNQHEKYPDYRSSPHVLKKSSGQGLPIFLHFTESFPEALLERCNSVVSWGLIPSSGSTWLQNLLVSPGTEQTRRQSPEKSSSSGARRGRLASLLVGPVQFLQVKKPALQPKAKLHLFKLVS